METKQQTAEYHRNKQQATLFHSFRKRLAIWRKQTANAYRTQLSDRHAHFFAMEETALNIH